MSTRLPAHFYWFQGNEYVLIRQACEKVFRRYPEATRQRVSVGVDTDWSSLAREITSPGLFANQTIWRVDFFEETPKKDAVDFTRHLIDQRIDISHSQPAEVIVVYSSAILPASQRKSKWYARLATASSIEVQWPLDRDEIPAWTQKQARGYHIKLDSEGLHYLISISEGNLSSLDRELYKLSLFEPTTKEVSLDLNTIRNCIEGDFSRHDPFALVHTALLQKPASFIRMLKHFEGEGTEIHQLLGAMRYVINQLIDLGVAAEQGESPENLIRYLPRKQKKLTLECLRLYNGARLSRLLVDLIEVEKNARGIRPFDPWGCLRGWCKRLQWDNWSTPIDRRRSANP